MDPIAAIVAFITLHPQVFQNLTGFQQGQFILATSWSLRSPNETLPANAKSYTGHFGTFSDDFEIIDPFTGNTSLARINNFNAIHDAYGVDPKQGKISCMMVHRKSTNQWELSAYSASRNPG